MLEALDRRNKMLQVNVVELRGVGLWWAHAVASGTDPRQLEVDSDGVLWMWQADPTGSPAEWIEVRRHDATDEGARQLVIERLGERVGVPLKALLSLQPVEP